MHILFDLKILLTIYLLASRLIRMRNKLIKIIFPPRTILENAGVVVVLWRKLKLGIDDLSSLESQKLPRSSVLKLKILTLKL